MAKLRYKLLILGLISLAIFVGPVNKASAHQLAKDGKISAFLHIAPDDKPVPGKINLIHFYYNDQDFRFTTEGCDCKIKVTEGNKTLYKGILPASGTRVGSVGVLLPDNNFSYAAIISGTPETAGFFQPFKLVFDIDVGNPPKRPVIKSQHTRFIIPAAGLILLAGGINYYPPARNLIRIKK